MKMFFGMIAASALALMGCGSLCDDAASASEDFDKKAAACSDEGSTTTKPTQAQINQCNKDVETSCTSDDQKQLASFLECIDKLPTCTKATEQQFAFSALACISGYNNVSEKCREALNTAD